MTNLLESDCTGNDEDKLVGLVPAPEFHPVGLLR